MTATKVSFSEHLQALVFSDGRVVPLRPQTSDVFRLFVNYSGRIITKDQIIDAVWGAQVVSDDSVYQCISEIRRAIGSAGGATIRTVARKGYVFEFTPELLEPIWSSSILLNAIPESINYVNSADGTQIAWNTIGEGVPILRAPNWITHLGAERQSIIYGLFYDRLELFAQVVRYDQRGKGMSSWFIPPLTMEAMSADILAVADAAGLDKFYLMGISQGVPFSLDFAARHPDRVLGIIGRGGYALGDLAGGNEQNRQTYEASIKLIEIGWESEDPTFRRNFTSRIAPDATPDMARQFDELQRISAPKENLLHFFKFDAYIDVTAAAREVKCPVLLMHSRGDRMVPFADGEHLASLLSNCTFVPLSGDNHTMVPGTDGFEEGFAAIEAYLKDK